MGPAEGSGGGGGYVVYVVLYTTLGSLYTHLCTDCYPYYMSMLFSTDRTVVTSHTQTPPPPPPPPYTTVIYADTKAVARMPSVCGYPTPPSSPPPFLCTLIRAFTASQSHVLMTAFSPWLEILTLGREPARAPFPVGSVCVCVSVCLCVCVCVCGGGGGCNQYAMYPHCASISGPLTTVKTLPWQPSSLTNPLPAPMGNLAVATVGLY